MATLKEAIDYARKNPQTDFARLLRQRLESGQADADAANEGIDISWAKPRVMEDSTDVENPVVNPQDVSKSVITRTKEAFKSRVDKAATEGARALGGEISPLRAGIRTVGQGAGFVGDVGFEALKVISPKFVENLAGKAVDAAAKTRVAQDLFKEYEAIKQKHPEAMKDIEAVFNIATLFPIGKGVSAGVQQGKKVTKAVGTKALEVGERALDKRRFLGLQKARTEIDDVVGKIIQGKADDIPLAKKALGLVDTDGVKTYKDLRTRIKDKVTVLSEKLDSLADEDPTPLKSDALTTTAKSGDVTVTENYVQGALDDFEELYKSTRDGEGLAKVQSLKKKLDSEGLSRREINQLAKDYGIEFKQKAFNQKGDALTSVNAQRFENTRKGIKSVFRAQMKGDAAPLIDKQITALKRTERLVGDMEKKVLALYQKAKKRGVLERISRKVADVVDIATMHTVTGFISRFIPSNVGLKTMNSLDLEQALSKSLKKFERLLKTTNDNELIEGLEKLLRESATPKKGSFNKSLQKSLQGGYVKNPFGKGELKIDQTDRQVAIDFIDSVRTGKVGNASVPKEERLPFEIEARMLAPGWGINPELPPSKLANAFDDILSRSR